MALLHSKLTVLGNGILKHDTLLFVDCILNKKQCSCVCVVSLVEYGELLSDNAG